jgi:hypothetical protein
MTTPRHAWLFIDSKMVPFRMPPLCAALEARGMRPVIVEIDRIPTEVMIHHHDEPEGTTLLIDVGGGPIPVRADDVVWSQGLRAGGALEGQLTGDVLSTATAETVALLEGFFQCLPCPAIPDLPATRASVSKGFQQRVARAHGLLTPRTLITNDPAAARAFVATCPGGAILKSVDRAVQTTAEGYSVNLGTRLVTPALLDKLDALRFSPLIFQERVPRAAELRVMVFGTAVFAAAFDADQVPPDSVDWRTDEQLYDQWRAWALPPAIRQSLLDVHDALGLQIGVADLIVTPDGDYLFLETNAWGQYYWLEMGAPRFPLSEALADVIADVPGARRRLP